MRYRRSLFGMLWTVLIPAGTACIYYFVFNVIFNVQIPNYLLFILSGIIPWSFFTSTITVGVESLVGNYALLSKVPVPLQALPLAEALTHLLNLLLSIPVILIAMVILHKAPTLAILQYPILLGLLFFVTYPLALILGILYVYFRDLKHIVALLIQLWFYATPVMYSTSMVPQKYRFLLGINPIGIIFSGFHASLVEDAWLTNQDWFIVCGWALLLILFSKFLLNRLNNSIVEML